MKKKHKNKLMQFEKFIDNNNFLHYFSQTYNKFEIPNKFNKEKDMLFREINNHIYNSNIEKIDENHKKSLNMLKDKNNPYSTYWINKMIKKKYGMKFVVFGFLNGVPIINMQKIKKDVIFKY